MTTVTCWSHRCRVNTLFAAILVLGAYALVFDTHDDVTGSVDDTIDWVELEQELDSSNPVHIVSYKSPLDETIFQPHDDEHTTHATPPARHPKSVQYHRVWMAANRLIDRHQMWPDTPEVDAILDAMAHAPIVGVDLLDFGDYESGTADKWIVTLDGGQKAVMKIIREKKGDMKLNALCNAGFEMPTSEIAAFHLHRVIGFRNTPYVTGRRVNIRTEVLPRATLAVVKQIVLNATGKGTCVRGKCYDCKDYELLCRHNDVFQVSLSYWIPRELRLHTFPDKYMPYATTRMDEWSKYGFNNRTYCDKVRRTIEPYDEQRFYLDLFDFAVIDALMYHFDSKHYSLSDGSSADGLVVRLDHGRAFCAYDRDDEYVFLAPISQCCTLRKSTYDNLLAVQGGILTKKLRKALDRDPIAPILEPAWFPALERRLKVILALVEKCITANGRSRVLVQD